MSTQSPTVLCLGEHLARVAGLSRLLCPFQTCFHEVCTYMSSACNHLVNAVSLALCMLSGISCLDHSEPLSARFEYATGFIGLICAVVLNLHSLQLQTCAQHHNMHVRLWWQLAPQCIASLPSTATNWHHLADFMLPHVNSISLYFPDSANVCPICSFSELFLT